MQTATKHTTPEDFLSKNLHLLEKNELDNNLILGICQGYEDKFKEQKNSLLISNYDNNGNIICSIKNTQIAVIGGNTNNEELVSGISNYYKDKKIDLMGVFGREDMAQTFSKLYGKPILKTKGMLSHKLDVLQQITITDGSFEVCSIEDEYQLIDFVEEFHLELNYFPKKDKEQIKSTNLKLIKEKRIFKWVKDNEIVSIAGIVRNTNNIGIIGLVYTPKQKRGKGFATNIVYNLSKHILNSGYKYSGLFTDIDNPTSNKIYKKIGYEPESKFIQIIYEI
jgi:hypothetical protein